MGILKPAYNAIDMVEVELLDDNSEPRQFSDDLLSVRILKKIRKINKSEEMSFNIENNIFTGSSANHQPAKWQ